MREPNLCFPSQNRAAVCITSALYDRRALDCTATLPLVNSLTHLAYLTSTSPRIREILCLDGGIERLVRILLQSQQQPAPPSNDKLTIWKMTLAFQSIVNVGVRGTEQIRTKVVEAGTIPLIINILSQYIKTHEITSTKKNNTKNIRESKNTTNPMNNTTYDNNTTTTAVQDKELLDSNSSLSSSAATTTTTAFNTNHPTSTATLVTPTSNALPSFNNNLNTFQASSTSKLSFKQRRRSTFPYVKIDPQQRRHRRIHKQQQQSKQRADSILNNKLFQREEDILLCLQLLAYLSKYPHVRDLFHTEFEKNVFSVVEKFCCSHRFHSTQSQHHTHSNSNNGSATNGPIQYWAGVIMRNACRRDDSKGGLRRCANLSCGKWETQPREFAKCRRCRKAKYCSKPCQSKAWADGHRWWCVERTSTTASSAAAAAAIAGALNTASTATTDAATTTTTTTTSMLPTAAVAATNAAIMATHTHHAATQTAASVIDHSNNGNTMSQPLSNDDDDDRQELMPRNTGFSFITRVPDQLITHQLRQQQQQHQHQPSTSSSHTTSNNSSGSSTSSSAAAAAAVAASTNATDNTTSFVDMSVHMEL